MATKILEKKNRLNRKQVSALTGEFEVTERTVSRWLKEGDDILTTPRVLNTIIGIEKITNNEGCPTGIWKSFTPFEKKSYNAFMSGYNKNEDLSPATILLMHGAFLRNRDLQKSIVANIFNS